MSTGRILQTAFSVAIILATIFTGLPPRVSSGLNRPLNLLLTPNAMADDSQASSNQPIKIGIVAGHLGYDSGAVCPDGTTEVDVNLSIATLVRQNLTALGYDVDLLQEFDTRLTGYRATLLISIHNDSCDYINEEATGFKVSQSSYSLDTGLNTRLTNCLVEQYAAITGLPYHEGSITHDMRDYHTFRELDETTDAVIIETGFLNKDYAILTQHPDIIAQGIVAGILCYLDYSNTPDTSGQSP